VFYRGIISLLMMGLYARFAGTSLYTPVPLMHFWRNVVGVTSLGAWFYALGKLPLATAMTLNYMSSVWIAAFLVGGTMMGTLTGTNADMRRQGPLVLAVLSGFVGVVMMLRPTIEQDQMFAGLVGLLSGFVSAFAYMHVMALGRAGEPVVRVGVLFRTGHQFGRWRWHVIERRITLELGPCGMAFAYRRIGLTGTNVPHPRLLTWCHLGGGQFAVRGHRVCGSCMAWFCLMNNCPPSVGQACG
jgi:hypothetical protein